MKDGDHDLETWSDIQSHEILTGQTLLFTIKVIDGFGIRISKFFG